MKKVGLLAGVLLGVFSAAAQAQSAGPTYALDRGSLLVDGSASFTSRGGDNDDDDDGDRNLILLVNPSVQYFIRPRLAVGGSVSLSYQNQGGSSSAGIGLGPRVTYFFSRPEAQLHPFVTASATWGRVGGDGSPFTYSGYRAAVGALHLLVPHVGITGELFYQADDFDDVFGVNTFGLAFGIAAFVF